MSASSTTVPAPAGRDRPGRSLAALWVSLVLPPLAFLAHLQVSYMLVSWTCVHRDVWWLHLVTLAALAVIAACGLTAWRALGALAHEPPRTFPESAGAEPPTREPRLPPRGRFLAKLALLVSALFFIALIAQGIPSFVLLPCQ